MDRARERKKRRYPHDTHTYIHMRERYWQQIRTLLAYDLKHIFGSSGGHSADYTLTVQTRMQTSRIMHPQRKSSCCSVSLCPTRLLLCSFPMISTTCVVILRNLRLLCTHGLRNIHNKIFGGYLMCEAYEIAWANALFFGRSFLSFRYLRLVQLRPQPRQIPNLCHTPLCYQEKSVRGFWDVTKSTSWLPSKLVRHA